MSKKLLITGFDPFGGESVNPSWEAVKRLPDQIGSWQLIKMEIPTIYEKAAQTVLEKAKETMPDCVLAVGQAGGRAGVTPEVIGINLREAKISDNAGVKHAGEPIREDGPAAYFATVPVRKMVQNIQNASLPASLSYSAGAFVCNDVLYSLLDAFSGTNVKAGFIHVPFLPEQAPEGVKSLPLADIVKALISAIEAMDEESR